MIHFNQNFQANFFLYEFYEVITSPGYPYPYTNNIDKMWNIDVGHGNTARIKFTAFALEDGADYVKVCLLLYTFHFAV